MADAAAQQADERAEPRWFACYTRARHEKKVADLLSGRGLENYLPLIGQMSQWKDRKKKVYFPLFPGYVFARFPLRELHVVLGLPGVSTIVRNNGRPQPIRDEDIENVRSVVAALESTGLVPEPRPFLPEGTRVRVKTGPFEGIYGRVAEQRGRRRVLIGLEAIGQGFEIDIDASQLEVVPEPGAD